MGLFDSLTKKTEQEFTAHQAFVLASWSMLKYDLKEKQEFKDTLEKIIEENWTRDTNLGKILNEITAIGIYKLSEVLLFFKIILQNDFLDENVDIKELIEENEIPKNVHKYLDNLIKLNSIFENEDIDEVVEIVAESLNEEEKITVISNLIDMSLGDGGVSKKEEELLLKYIEAFDVDKKIIENIIAVLSSKTKFLA